MHRCGSSGCRRTPSCKISIASSISPSAVNSLPNRIYRDYLLLLMFTGLRRNEASSLRWSQVDFAGRLFCVTETKNNRPLTLPLSDFLYDLLLQRKALTGNSPFVFPGKGKAGYLSEPKKGIAAVSKMTEISFTAHDLRRSFITIAESLNIPHYALKALINHKASDITGTYIVI